MSDEQYQEGDIEYYGEPGIASYEGGVPSFLKVNYVLWLIVGLVCLGLYWNGSWGWLDRGYWQQLQIAANTTFPIVNQQDPSLKEKTP